MTLLEATLKIILKMFVIYPTKIFFAICEKIIQSAEYFGKMINILFSCPKKIIRTIYNNIFNGILFIFSLIGKSIALFIKAITTITQSIRSTIVSIVQFAWNIFRAVFIRCPAKIIQVLYTSLFKGFTTGLALLTKIITSAIQTLWNVFNTLLITYPQKIITGVFKTIIIIATAFFTYPQKIIKILYRSILASIRATLALLTKTITFIIQFILATFKKVIIVYPAKVAGTILRAIIIVVAHPIKITKALCRYIMLVLTFIANIIINFAQFIGSILKTIFITYPTSIIRSISKVILTIFSLLANGIIFLYRRMIAILISGAKAIKNITLFIVFILKAVLITYPTKILTVTYKTLFNVLKSTLNLLTKIIATVAHASEIILKALLFTYPKKIVKTLFKVIKTIFNYPVKIVAVLYKAFLESIVAVLLFFIKIITTINKSIDAFFRKTFITYPTKIITLCLRMMLSLFILYPSKAIGSIRKRNMKVKFSEPESSSSNRYAPPISIYSTSSRSIFNKQVLVLGSCLSLVALGAFGIYSGAHGRSQATDIHNSSSSISKKLSSSMDHLFKTLSKVLNTSRTPKVFAVSAVTTTTDKGTAPTQPMDFKITDTNNSLHADVLPTTPVYVMVQAKDITTFSSETAATILQIPFKEGDRFQIGDTLIKFDCRVSQAELRKAQAQQKATDIANKSANKLKSYGSISEAELIKASADLEIASAEVEKLSATVDKCTIKAPYDGAVSEKYAHTGETVKPGDPLLKVVNTDSLELQMQVPSIWLEWLHIGSIFNVVINENRKTVVAKVAKINPQIDPVSQTVRIMGVLTEADPTLLPGMSGQANFQDNPAKNNIRVGS